MPHDPIERARSQETPLLDREVDARSVDTDTALIVDVREPWEWDEGHIPTAIHIPLGELPDRAQEIPGDDRVVFVCHLGVRSLYAVDVLEAMGRPGARSLAGGMNAWHAYGFPVAMPNESTE